MRFPLFTRAPLCALALAAAATVLTAARLEAAPATVSVDVYPARIASDEAAELTVALEGSSNARPSVPGVPGLTILPSGQSSRFEMVNGITSSRVIHHFTVSAARPGRYVIGPVRVGGATSKQVTLVVEAPSAAEAGAGNEVDEPEDREPGRRAFLRITPAATTAYVGQLIPVTISAYFRRGLDARLESLPQLEGAAFALHDVVQKAERDVEYVDGQAYVVLRWKAAVSAIKAGSYELAAKQEASVRVPVKRKPRNRRRPRRARTLADDFFGGDFFNDSFFDDDLLAGFFQRGRDVALPLASEPHSVTVRDLPLAGRPADFHGAVGRFTLDAQATPSRVEVGDPVTLRASIRGAGNFDRVTQPALAAEKGWKTYPGKHEFVPHDEAKTQGVKMFEWTVIPEEGGEQALPPVSFSYFDPTLAAYQTLTAPLPTVVVTGRRKASTPVAEAPSSEPGVAANRAEALGHVSLTPLIDRTPVRIVAGLFGLTLLFGLVLCVRARLLAPGGARQAERRQHERSAVAMAAMDTAIARGRVRAFFSAARNAIAIALGPELDVRGNERLASVLRAGDAASYARHTFSAQDLEYWKREVELGLAEVEAQG